MKKTLITRALPWLIVLATVVLWGLVCWAFRIPSFVLPGPIEVAGALMKYPKAVFVNAGYTLFTTLMGFAIAVVFGVALGVVVGSSRVVYDALYPIMIAFNSIPKVAIVPVLVIWFGIGTIPAVITAFALSFFPIVVNIATGLATIEPEILDVLRVLGARKRQILMKIGLPRAMPYFFASLKVSITLAFVGSVVAETAASNHGIGYLMIAASARFDVALVFAGLVVIAAMGISLYECFAFLERRVTFWASRDNGIVS
ncbi:ABC transporter permease [Aquabacter sp. CN5-332]|uniref:ABC transporter permease n=1 Tax=Aquabacter sp. CN5-332 TaxID=3156608 RepID=UPI0032B4FC95